MSALRTQLEDAQVRVKQLTAELAAPLPSSPERVALEQRRAALPSQVAALEQEVARLQLDAEALRVRVSNAPWWRTPLTIPFAIVGLIATRFVIAWVVENANWAGLAWRFGWSFALAPLVVNGARYLLGRLKLARRRQLGGGMKTE